MELSLRFLLCFKYYNACFILDILLINLECYTNFVFICTLKGLMNA